MDEEPTLTLLIAKAIEKAKTEPQTREAALTITKLQEAAMWNVEHLKALRSKVEAAGFKPSA